MDDKIIKTELKSLIRVYGYLREAQFDLERDIMEIAGLDYTDEEIDESIGKLLEEWCMVEETAAEKIIEYAEEARDNGNL